MPRQDRSIYLLIIVAACAAYLPTVQPVISASNLSYFTDVGSVQDALNVWGTLHSSGYPLFSLTGAAFVALTKALGVIPAAAASLFSTVWAIAALIVFYAFIKLWLNDRLIALLVTALLGVGWMFWMFASVAEVYTLSWFVTGAALWLALKADRTRQARYLYGLAVCAGMVVAHHRAIALALPAPLLIALPVLWAEVRRRWTFLLKAGLLALLVGLAPYAYLPLRVAQGATWVWGDPTSVDGLWRLISGATYTNLIAWPPTAGAWLDQIGQVAGIWFDMATWPIVALGAIGWLVMIARRQFRWAAGLVLTAAIGFVLAISVHVRFNGEPIEDTPALLLPAVICALCGFAFLLNELHTLPLSRLHVGVIPNGVRNLWADPPRCQSSLEIPQSQTTLLRNDTYWRSFCLHASRGRDGYLGMTLSCGKLSSSLRARIGYCAGMALGVAMIGVMAINNLPTIYAYTHDAIGSRIIADAQQFVADGHFSTPPAFFSPWSGEFWALAYGMEVTHEIENFNLLPNRANLKDAVERYGRVHTFEHTFYNRGLEWWRKRLGTVYLSSSGVKTVAIGMQPLVSANDLPRNNLTSIAMGDAPIGLRDWQATPLDNGQWQITLYWQATAKPDRDYSVFVQASDRDAIDSPDAIVAQADSSAPVQGRYPTTLWSPGEIVRDDHLIAPPADRAAKIVVVGLYLQDEAGRFINFGRQVIPLRAAR
jgi:hypothetical protein